MIPVRTLILLGILLGCTSVGTADEVKTDSEERNEASYEREISHLLKRQSSLKEQALWETDPEKQAQMNELAEKFGFLAEWIVKEKDAATQEEKDKYNRIAKAVRRKLNAQKKLLFPQEDNLARARPTPTPPPSIYKTESGFRVRLRFPD